PMELSADLMLEELRKTITSDMFGKKISDRDSIKKILSNTELFGTDLVNAGLADRIIDIFEEMLSAPGAVRKALAEATK
ncbi:MAG: mannitol dehydrogenase family protein, partial [Ruminiclostridium sp.]|nr:mannitol dehydrogenase family protein [Ruminiclostridium sp.]